MAEYEGTVEEPLPMLVAQITQLRVAQEANRLIALALLAQLSRLRGVSLQKLSRDVTNSTLRALGPLPESDSEKAHAVQRIREKVEGYFSGLDGTAQVIGFPSVD